MTRKATSVTSPHYPPSSYPCATHTPLTAINQTLWPTHCVQGQDDSDFHPSLLHWPSDLVVRQRPVRHYRLV